MQYVYTILRHIYVGNDVPNFTRIAGVFLNKILQKIFWSFIFWTHCRKTDIGVLKSLLCIYYVFRNFRSRGKTWKSSGDYVRLVEMNCVTNIIEHLTSIPQPPPQRLITAILRLRQINILKSDLVKTGVSVCRLCSWGSLCLFYYPQIQYAVCVFDRPLQWSPI